MVDAVLRDLRAGEHRGVVVDSPPGAGKSTLVVRAAGELAATRRAADDRRADQRAGRRPDRAARRADARRSRSAGCPRSTTTPSERVRGHPSCRVGAKVADLGGAGGHDRDGRQVGDGRRGHLAVGDRRRGLPDALGRAAAAWRRGSSGRCSSAIRASSTRSRPWTSTAGPACRGTRCRAPSRCCCGTIPTCRCTGCRSPGGCRTPPRRWSPRRSTRSPASARAPGRAIARCGSARRGVGRARRGARHGGGHRLGAARAAGPVHHPHRRRGGGRLRARWPGERWPATPSRRPSPAAAR